MPVLVDRPWPRGLTKEHLAIDACRGVAWYRVSGTGLRVWYGHRPGRWDEFRTRYQVELRLLSTVALREQLACFARAGTLALVFGARDETRNQAIVIRQAVQDLLAAEPGPVGGAAAGLA